MSKEISDTTQHARFLETARALGCDEGEKAFDEKLRTITKPLPVKNGDPGGGGADKGEDSRQPKS